MTSHIPSISSVSSVTAAAVNIATQAQLSATSQAHLISSMAQLNTDYKEREELREQLALVSQQLAKAREVLAQKNNIINSLEVDLEHMVSQLTRIQADPSSNKVNHVAGKWINRTVPGLSV